MVTLKIKESTVITIIIVGLLIVFGVIYISFSWGYYQRAHDINVRISKFPNNQEECFTREEVDNFIYNIDEDNS